MFGVATAIAPIFPEPLVRLTDVVPVTVPADCVIAPVVDAVIVSTVPDTLAPRAMPPVAVVASKLRAPVAVIVLLMVIAPAPAAVSVKLNIAPVDTPLPVIAWELVKVTLPVVLARTFGVAKLSGPITPDPDARVTDVVPVMIDAPVMVPVVEAVIVSTVPDTAAPMTTPPVAVLAIKLNAPPAVIVLVMLTAVADAAESVKLKALPLDTPLPVIATVSVIVTLPLVLAVMTGVATVIAPIAPEPLVRLTDVVPVTVPAD